MKTVSLWNVPVSVAQEVADKMRRIAADMLSEPNTTAEDVRDYLYTVTQIEDEIKAAELRTFPDDEENAENDG